MTGTTGGAAKTNGTRLKGLVLAGGKGSRLRPLTATGAKQLVPVANRPVLFYGLAQLVEAGITEIGIITGDTGEQIRAAVGDGSAFGANVTYLPQSAPLGLAHAVFTARDFLGDDPFCMFLGDNFLRGGIARYADDYRAAPCAAQVLLKHVDDPSALGVAVLDETGRVRRLVEKPRELISHLVVIGIYFFGPEIHRIIPDLAPSPRGELEITDAIQGLIDAGRVVRSARVDDDWIDTGGKNDMLEANRIVLATIQRRIEGEVDAASRIIGDVVIEPGARVERCTILGPVIIGRNARLVDAYVGPFTAVGCDCELANCEIEHSIVMERSALRFLSQRVADSLIGRDVVVDRSPHRPQVVRLLLGDHSRVDLV
jgi:glucose-1-phosphate thymidylyltransferase